MMPPRFSAHSPRRRWRTACAAVLGATALMVASATAAYAQTIPSQKVSPQLSEQFQHPALPVSQYYVRYWDYNTGRCLDGNGTSAYTDPCFSGGDTYQEWAYYLTSYSETLQSLQTGRCMDSNYAGNVYNSPCNGNNTYENWQFGGQGPGFTINDYQTGLCLDSNSNGNIYTDPCNWNNYYQNWMPDFS